MVHAEFSNTKVCCVRFKDTRWPSHCPGQKRKFHCRRTQHTWCFRRMDRTASVGLCRRVMTPLDRSVARTEPRISGFKSINDLRTRPVHLEVASDSNLCKWSGHQRGTKTLSVSILQQAACSSREKMLNVGLLSRYSLSSYSGPNTSLSTLYMQSPRSRSRRRMGHSYE